MIDRRRFIVAACGFVASPALVRATSIMPVRASRHITIDSIADAGSVLFTIHGWDGDDSSRAGKAGQIIVPIHLPNSWRSAWL